MSNRLDKKNLHACPEGNATLLPVSLPTFLDALIPTAYLDLLPMKRETRLLRPFEKLTFDFCIILGEKRKEIIIYYIRIYYRRLLI